MATNRRSGRAQDGSLFPVYREQGKQRGAAALRQCSEDIAAHPR